MWIRLWKAVVQLFYVGVVLWVFSRLEGRSEFLMVALFGIIYVTIRTAYITNYMVTHSVTIALQNEFDRIKLAVIPDFEIDQEEQATIKKELAKVTQSLWFEYGGLAAVTLICFWNLFVTLS